MITLRKIVELNEVTIEKNGNHARPCSHVDNVSHPTNIVKAFKEPLHAFFRKAPRTKIIKILGKAIYGLSQLLHEYLRINPK
jgi:hypothetical protein